MTMTPHARLLEKHGLIEGSDDWTGPSFSRRGVALYVDRTTGQWVVRDSEGEFWRLPSIDDCWKHREPFDLSDDSELESVPGHYLYMLNLPI